MRRRDRNAGSSTPATPSPLPHRPPPDASSSARPTAGCTALGDTYRLRRRVQFYETDVAGIVHFSWFFRYMEEAEHALWRQAGLRIHPDQSDIGWPRVAASFEFHRPLRFEDEFD